MLAIAEYWFQMQIMSSYPVSGTLKGFETAIKFIGSSGGEVTDVTLTDNKVGLLLSGSQGIEISRNTITNNGFAIVSASSNDATMAFNNVVGNQKQGIVLQGSGDNIIAAKQLVWQRG